MGKHDNNNNELRDKMNMHDEVKITVIQDNATSTEEVAPVVEEEKKEEVKVVINSPANNNKPEVIKPIPKTEVAKVVVASTGTDKIAEEIAELEKVIQENEEKIKKSKNSINNAIYGDKILQAKIRITELKGDPNPAEKTIQDVKAYKVSDADKPKSENETWKFPI